MSALRIGAAQVRNIMTSAVRTSGIPGGIPTSSLPFKAGNPVKLTVYFILFFGSGLAAPFWLVRHQLLKK